MTHLEKPRGLIYQAQSFAEFNLTRILPDPALANIVENYWVIEWHRPDQPDYIQQNMPHPSQNLVIDLQGQSGLFGIITERFSYTITQAGAIFGCKFRPGALRAFIDMPMKNLTNKCVPLSSHFEAVDKELIATFRSANDKPAFAEAINNLLLSYPKIKNEKIQQAGKLVAAIDSHPGIKTVANLADHANTNPRALQRLFNDYIGVSPTWTIQRYRIINAVDAINKGEAVDLTSLAHELGFFDSAHFSKSFKALVGTSPSQYQAISRSLSSKP